MKNKITILLILLWYSPQLLLGQTGYELATSEMKYWKLRGRLTGDINNNSAAIGVITNYN